MSKGGTEFDGMINLDVGNNTVAVTATDASNQTITKNYQVVVPPGTSSTPTYDLNGNMLTDGSGKSYRWDAANRLAKITYSDASSTAFSYDPFGRRIRIIEKNSAGTPTAEKAISWVGLEIVAESEAISGAIKLYFPQGFRDVGSSTNYYYTKDHLGSVREVLNSTGGVVARYSYDPYGRVTKVSGTVDSDFLYTGHYNHLPSGLAIAPYREYSAELGRWLSRDPIGEAGGINLYGYVSNNPINFWDPLGLDQMNLLPIDDPAHAARNARPLASDAYEVVGHGFNAYYMLDSNRNLLSPEKLAQLIRQDPNYDPSKPVRLNSCGSGDSRSPSGTSFGKRLAEHLQNQVIAPTTNVMPSYRRNLLGGWRNGPDRLRDSGTWEDFYPDSWYTANAGL